MTEQTIPKDYDHHRERYWQSQWKNKEVYKFIGDGKRPRYIIDTPPPYPTGSIHMGHVLNWVFMDIIARFKRMQGFDVMFPQGWDCHGLPTEVKVEEIHQIKKNDVPREKFRKMCIELTQKNIKLMKEQMQRLGFSQDWNREYITMTDWYMHKTQLSFLELYKQNLIYRGVHPVNWCPRCETAIAFAEVEYKSNRTNLNYLKFPLSSQEDLIIATTRPELLAACVAVVVHPEDERYQKYEGKKVEVPLFQRKVDIITDPEVDPEFGTGAVMICTFGDKTDVSWVNRYDLEVIEAIDEQGLMTSASGKYEGLTLKECKEKIICDLEDAGYLLKQETVEQNVGQCWRCKTPIEILVKNQWFVAVKELIEQVKESTDRMDWKPTYMKTRLLNWTGSMDWDWCISRQRIFATPIPVWYCVECGEIQLPYPEELPLDPTQTMPSVPCTCGSTSFHGEEDVLDTWMDSSLTPLIIAGWPQADYIEYYPADLRPQGHDIIRTWAFYTILRCTALTGESPFRQIVVNGMVSGEDGYKMSKSRGNVIIPEEVLEDYGADALRLWAGNSVPGSDVPFAWKDVKYGYKFLRKFWNAFRFISLHISSVIDEEKVIPHLNPLDRWILSQLYYLVEEVTQALIEFNFAQAITKIQRFIWHDFCDEYIEAVKYRLYQEGQKNQESADAAKYTLRKVIITSLKLLAPFTPHFTEEIYQHLGSAESIHLTSWPQIREEFKEEEFPGLGGLGVEIITELRRFKSSQGMPLNTPLPSVTIYTEKPELYDQLSLLREDVQGTMRIQKLRLEKGKPDIQEQITEITPRMEMIGPKYKKDAPSIVKYLKSADIKRLGQELEDRGRIVIGDYEVTGEYVQLKKEILSRSGERVDIISSVDGDVVMEIVI